MKNNILTILNNIAIIKTIITIFVKTLLIIFTSLYNYKIFDDICKMN